MSLLEGNVNKRFLIGLKQNSCAYWQQYISVNDTKQGSLF